MSRARCVVAQAEIALAARELSWQPHALEAAQAVLDAHGDHANAAHARSVAARRLLLIAGRMRRTVGSPRLTPPPCPLRYGPATRWRWRAWHSYACSCSAPPV